MPNKTANMVADRLEIYGDYVFEAKKASIEDIAEDDIKIAIEEIKDSAPGMDQWSVADVKFPFGPKR